MVFWNRRKKKIQDEVEPDSGSYSISEPHYPIAFALPAYLLPESAMSGLWKIAVDYNGEHYEHPFTVSQPAGAPAPPTVSPQRIHFSPNPFFSETMLKARGIPGPVGAQIFSPGGHLIRTLASKAGNANLTSDGCDDTRRRQAGGVYLIRILHGGDCTCERVVLLR